MSTMRPTCMRILRGGGLMILRERIGWLSSGAKPEVLASRLACRKHRVQKKRKKNYDRAFSKNKMVAHVNVIIWRRAFFKKDG